MEATTKFALRSVALRYQRLSEEISELDEQLGRLVAQGSRLPVPKQTPGFDTLTNIDASPVPRRGSRTFRSPQDRVFMDLRQLLLKLGQ